MADNYIRIKLELDGNEAKISTEQLAKAYRVLKSEINESNADLVRSTQTIKTSVSDIYFGIQNAIFAIRGAVAVYGSFVDASNEIENANRKLRATSKLTGAELESLIETAANSREEYALSVQQANEFTIALTKLGQKAGDVTRTGEAIRRLLDLAAAQGLNAEQALVAINQAILGIDEGTDKLFQKNPSVIYKEYADTIGTTAGKLSDQQKAQALFNAVLTDGAKVQGEYNEFLKTGSGAQAQFNTVLTEFKASFGAILNEVLIPFLQNANGVLRFLQDMPPQVKEAVLYVSLLTSALAALRISGVTSIGIVNRALVGLRATISGLFTAIGPAGWFILGLTTLIELFGGFSSDDFVDELDDISAGLDKVSLKGDEAARALALIRKGPLKENLDEVKAEYDDFKKYLDGLTFGNANFEAAKAAFEYVDAPLAQIEDRLKRIEANDYLGKQREQLALFNEVMKKQGEEQLTLDEFLAAKQKETDDQAINAQLLQVQNLGRLQTYLTKILQHRQKITQAEQEYNAALKLANGEFEKQAQAGDDVDDSKNDARAKELRDRINALNLQKEQIKLDEAQADTIEKRIAVIEKEARLNLAILNSKLELAKLTGEEAQDVEKIEFEIKLTEERLKIERAILELDDSDAKKELRQRLDAELLNLQRDRKQAEIDLNEAFQVQQAIQAESGERALQLRLIEIRRQAALDRLELERQTVINELTEKFKGVENEEQLQAALLEIEKRYKAEKALINKESETDAETVQDDLVEQIRIVQNAAQGLENTLQGVLVDQWINGISAAKNFERAVTQLIANLAAQIVAKAGVFALLSAFGGAPAGGLLEFIGFAEGGFTGGNQRDEIRGVVHGGEWVAKKKFVDAEPGLFNYLQNIQVKGYAEGGFVDRVFNNVVNTSAPAVSVDLSGLEARLDALLEKTQDIYINSALDTQTFTRESVKPELDRINKKVL